MERLVPLAVAVAKDKVVHALQARIERLKAEISLTVRITGDNGTPTYASGRFSLSHCRRTMGRGNSVVRVELEAEEGAAACPLSSLHGLRLVISGEEGLGPDVVMRLRFFRNHVGVRVRGERLEFSVHVHTDAVNGQRVFRGITVRAPAPPETAEDEDYPNSLWFAAPSALFEKSIKMAEGVWFSYPPAPFAVAVAVNASIWFQSVVVDACELFKALARRGPGGNEGGGQGR